MAGIADLHFAGVDIQKREGERDKHAGSAPFAAELVVHLASISAGKRASAAFARRSVCETDMKSAAGTPLPATSAASRQRRSPSTKKKS